MKKEDLIKKIKTQLKSLLVKMAEYKAGDILITSQDEILTVGSEVFSVDADGNNVPLNDGEYILDAGMKIEVEGGKIKEISEQEEVETPETPETPVEASEIVGEVEEVENGGMKPYDKEEDKTKMIDELNKKIMDLTDRLEKLEGEKLSLTEKVETLSKLPAIEKTEVKPVEFRSLDDKKSGLSVDLSAVRDMARKKLRG